MTEEQLIERMAVEIHNSWARWTLYLLDKFTPNADGSITLPAEYVAALRRQCKLHYYALDAREQQADRDEVRYFLPTIQLYANHAA